MPSSGKPYVWIPKNLQFSQLSQRGHVTHIEKNNKNTMRITYSVLYKDDPDVPVSYPLFSGQPMICRLLFESLSEEDQTGLFTSILQNLGTI